MGCTDGAMSVMTSNSIRHLIGRNERGVSVAPGQAFYSNGKGQRQFRLCSTALSKDQLRRWGGVAHECSAQGCVKTM